QTQRKTRYRTMAPRYLAVLTRGMFCGRPARVAMLMMLILSLMYLYTFLSRAEPDGSLTPDTSYKQRMDFPSAANTVRISGQNLSSTEPAGKVVRSVYQTTKAKEDKISRGSKINERSYLTGIKLETDSTKKAEEHEQTTKTTETSTSAKTKAGDPQNTSTHKIHLQPVSLLPTGRQQILVSRQRVSSRASLAATARRRANTSSTTIK
ncbi:hypothetical protein BaRGS_00024288, partial [Batillaria attramentaria]